MLSPCPILLLTASTSLINTFNVPFPGFGDTKSIVKLKFSLVPTNTFSSSSVEIYALVELPPPPPEK